MSRKRRDLSPVTSVADMMRGPSHRELLLTCPICGRSNYTPQGLLVHRCAKLGKKQIPQADWQRAKDEAIKKAGGAVR